MEPTGSPLNRFRSSPTVRNLGRVLIGDILAKSFVLLYTLLLIRRLPEAEYAGLVVFQSVRLLFAGMVGSGINRALVRFGTDSHSRTGTRPIGLYRAVLKIEVGIYLVVLAVGVPFADRLAGLFFGRTEYGHVLMFGLFGGAGYLLLQFGRGICQAEERFKEYAAAMWIEAAVILLYMTALLATDRLSLWYVVPGFVVADLLVSMALLARRLATDRTTTSPAEPVPIAPLLKAMGWLVAYSAMLQVLTQMDVIMLSHLSSKTDLASYGVALRYYILALMSLGVVHAVLLPKFSRVDMQDHARQRDFTRRWLRLAPVIALPIVLINVFGRDLFVWLNGGRYQEAWPIWVVLSVGIWISLLASPQVNILVSRRWFRTLFALGAAGLLTSYLVCLWLIPIWGGIGSATATVAANAVINVTAVWLIWRAPATEGALPVAAGQPKRIGPAATDG